MEALDTVKTLHWKYVVYALIQHQKYFNELCFKQSNRVMLKEIKLIVNFSLRF